jgi:hypothetical protein
MEPMGSTMRPSSHSGGASVQALVLSLLLLALPALALGQSLAEAARKEKARRDEVRKTGPPTRVVTEEELKTTRGQPVPPESPAASKPPSPPPLDSSRQERAQKEAYWRTRGAEARQRLAVAEQRYAELDRMIRIGQPARFDENGRRYIVSQQRMKVLADEAEAEVANAKKALEDLDDAARRAGALPGWLR